jgi:hypothetical protein
VMQALVSRHASESPRLREPASAARVSRPPSAAAPRQRVAPHKRPSNPPARSVRRWFERLSASRSFWQALTVLGAVLLALVASVALWPDALLSLGPIPHPRASTSANAVFVPKAPVGSATTAPSPSANDATGHADSAAQPLGAPPARQPSAAQEQREHAQIATVATIATAHAPGAVAHVHVVPGGRIWIDQQLRGEARPDLDVDLSAGPHLIAAGRDTPIASHSVELHAGESEVVAFDLGGK